MSEVELPNEVRNVDPLSDRLCELNRPETLSGKCRWVESDMACLMKARLRV